MDCLIIQVLLLLNLRIVKADPSLSIHVVTVTSFLVLNLLLLVAIVEDTYDLWEDLSLRGLYVRPAVVQSALNLLLRLPQVVFFTEI
jgi:hypothetical protein